MRANSSAWLQIHLCVVLWGFTAILGRLITLPVLALVLWRMFLVTCVLLLLPKVWRAMRRLSGRHLLAIIGVGVVVALHWLGFYGAVKLANASVAATCMALIPIFLCVIEPMVTGRRFQPRELLFGALVLPGIMLVAGGTPSDMNAGIICGVLAALMAAVFGAFNKRLIMRTDALTMTALEMGSGFAFLLFLAVAGMLLPLGDTLQWLMPEQLLVWPSSADMGYLLILAFACTLLPFALSLHALRHLSAYATALAVNLEPVYAIILAILLLDEQQQLTGTFYGGAALILAVVFVYARGEAKQV